MPIPTDANPLHPAGSTSAGHSPTSLGIASKIKKAAKPVVAEQSIASKIKDASKIGAAAKAAKKTQFAPVGKRVQATYPIQRPPKTKFVRVHPSPEYRQYNVPVLEDPDTQELYFVEDSVPLPDLVAESVRHVNLYAAQMHDRTFFLWAVKQSDTPWYKSARIAATKAVQNWYMVRARKAANTYDLIAPHEPIPEPDWSALPSFEEMLESAFDEHVISSLDHRLIRKLQGALDDDADDADLI